MKWKYFPRYWPFVWGIHLSSVNSPHKGQWRGALMFSLICVLINDWVNNREAGDLRRCRAHYDVSVMSMLNPNTHSSVCRWCPLEHISMDVWSKHLRSTKWISKCPLQNVYLLYISMNLNKNNKYILTIYPRPLYIQDLFHDIPGKRKHVINVRLSVGL